MKKKKDRHEWGAGSVSQCGTGWRVRIRLPDGRRVGEVVATKEEAEKLRAALVAERAAMAREGAFVPRAGKTLEGGASSAEVRGGARRGALLFRGGSLHARGIAMKCRPTPRKRLFYGPYPGPATPIYHADPPTYRGAKTSCFAAQRWVGTMPGQGGVSANVTHENASKTRRFVVGRQVSTWR